MNIVDAILDEAFASSNGEPWQTPIPLSGPALPPFPVDALPPILRDWSRGMADAVQIAVDVPAMFALGAMSAAAAGLARVVVEYYQQELIFWPAVFLPSGERKTPIVDAARQGIEYAEHDLIGTAAHHKSPPQLLVDDATPEALGKVMAANHGRIALITDEGGIFDVIAGRYSNRGTPPNLDVLLRGYDGGSVRTARITREQDRIDRALLTMACAAQPSVLSAIGGNDFMRSRGFLARFSFALPTSLVGMRKLADRKRMPDDVAGAFRQMVRELARLPRDGQQLDEPPATIATTPGALDAWASFHDEIEGRTHPDSGDMADVSDWANKHAARVARVAALMHLAANGPVGLSRHIDADTMRGAIEIGRYLIPHAVEAFAKAGTDDGRRWRADRVLRWLATKGISRFTEREAMRAVMSSGRIPNMEALRPALRMLTDHGYIRCIQQPTTGPDGGRPTSPVYAVNPLWDRTSHKAG